MQQLKVTPPLGGGAVFSRRPLEPLLLEVSAPALPDSPPSPLAGSFWTNLPSSVSAADAEVDGEGVIKVPWHAVPLGTRGPASLHGLVFGWAPGTFELTARVRDARLRAPTDADWTWLGGFGDNARLQVLGVSPSATKLFPPLSPCLAVAVAHAFLAGIFALAPGVALPAYQEFLVGLGGGRLPGKSPRGASPWPASRGGSGGEGQSDRSASAGLPPLPGGYDRRSNPVHVAILEAAPGSSPSSDGTASGSGGSKGRPTPRGTPAAPASSDARHSSGSGGSVGSGPSTDGSSSNAEVSTPGWRARPGSSVSSSAPVPLTPAENATVMETAYVAALLMCIIARAQHNTPYTIIPSPMVLAAGAALTAAEEAEAAAAAAASAGDSGSASSKVGFSEFQGLLHPGLTSPYSAPGEWVRGATSSGAGTSRRVSGGGFPDATPRTDASSVASALSPISEVSANSDTPHSSGGGCPSSSFTSVPPLLQPGAQAMVDLLVSLPVLRSAAARLKVVSRVLGLDNPLDGMRLMEELGRMPVEAAVAGGVVTPCLARAWGLGSPAAAGISGAGGLEPYPETQEVEEDEGDESGAEQSEESGGEEADAAPRAASVVASECSCGEGEGQGGDACRHADGHRCASRGRGSVAGDGAASSRGSSQSTSTVATGSSCSGATEGASDATSGVSSGHGLGTTSHRALMESLSVLYGPGSGANLRARRAREEAAREARAARRQAADTAADAGQATGAASAAQAEPLSQPPTLACTNVSSPYPQVNKGVGEGAASSNKLRLNLTGSSRTPRSARLSGAASARGRRASSGTSGSGTPASAASGWSTSASPYSTGEWTAASATSGHSSVTGPIGGTQETGLHMSLHQWALYVLARWAGGGHFDASDGMQPLALDLFLNALQSVHPGLVHQSLVTHVLTTLCTSAPGSTTRTYFTRGLRTLFIRGNAKSNAATLRKPGDSRVYPNLAKSVVVAVHDIIHAHVLDTMTAQSRSRALELPPLSPTTASLTLLPSHAGAGGVPETELLAKGEGVAGPQGHSSSSSTPSRPNPKWSTLSPAAPPPRPQPVQATGEDASVSQMLLSGSGAGLMTRNQSFPAVHGQISGPRSDSPAPPMQRLSAAAGTPTRPSPLRHSASGSWGSPGSGGLGRAGSPPPPSSPRALPAADARLLETSARDAHGFDLLVLMGFVSDLLHDATGGKSSAVAAAAAAGLPMPAPAPAPAASGGQPESGAALSGPCGLSCASCGGGCAVRLSVLTSIIGSEKQDGEKGCSDSDCGGGGGGGGCGGSGGGSCSSGGHSHPHPSPPPVSGNAPVDADIEAAAGRVADRSIPPPQPQSGIFFKKRVGTAGTAALSLDSGAPPEATPLPVPSKLDAAARAAAGDDDTVVIRKPSSRPPPIRAPANGALSPGPGGRGSAGNKQAGGEQPLLSPLSFLLPLKADGRPGKPLPGRSKGAAAAGKKSSGTGSGSASPAAGGGGEDASPAGSRQLLVSLCPSADHGGASLALWMETARAVAYAAVKLSSVPDGGSGVTPEYKAVLSCAIQLCAACPLLREIVLRRILRKWPTGNSDNEVALLEMLATVLAMTTHRADLVVTDLRSLMLGRVVRSLRSLHIKVARNALVLADPSKHLIDFLVDDADALQRLLEALTVNVASHWSPLIRRASQRAYTHYATKLVALGGVPPALGTGVPSAGASPDSLSASPYGVAPPTMTPPAGKGTSSASSSGSNSSETSPLLSSGPAAALAGRPDVRAKELARLQLQACATAGAWAVLAAAEVKRGEREAAATPQAAAADAPEPAPVPAAAVTTVVATATEASPVVTATALAPVVDAEQPQSQAAAAPASPARAPAAPPATAAVAAPAPAPTPASPVAAPAPAATVSLQLNPRDFGVQPTSDPRAYAAAVAAAMAKAAAAGIPVAAAPVLPVQAAAAATAASGTSSSGAPSSASPGFLALPATGGVAFTAYDGRGPGVAVPPLTLPTQSLVPSSAPATMRVGLATAPSSPGADGASGPPVPVSPLPPKTPPPPLPFPAALNAIAHSPSQYAVSVAAAMAAASKAGVPAWMPAPGAMLLSRSGSSSMTLPGTASLSSSASSASTGTLPDGTLQRSVGSGVFTTTPGGGVSVTVPVTFTLTVSSPSAVGGMGSEAVTPLAGAVSSRHHGIAGATAQGSPLAAGAASPGGGASGSTPAGAMTPLMAGVPAGSSSGSSYLGGHGSGSGMPPRPPPLHIPLPGVQGGTIFAGLPAAVAARMGGGTGGSVVASPVVRAPATVASPPATQRRQPGASPSAAPAAALDDDDDDEDEEPPSMDTQLVMPPPTPVPTPAVTLYAGAGAPVLSPVAGSAVGAGGGSSSSVTTPVNTLFIKVPGPGVAGSGWGTPDTGSQSGSAPSRSGTATSGSGGSMTATPRAGLSGATSGPSTSPAPLMFAAAGPSTSTSGGGATPAGGGIALSSISHATAWTPEGPVPLPTVSLPLLAVPASVTPLQMRVFASATPVGVPVAGAGGSEAAAAPATGAAAFLPAGSFALTSRAGQAGASDGATTPTLVAGLPAPPSGLATPPLMASGSATPIALTGALAGLAAAATMPHKPKAAAAAAAAAAAVVAGGSSGSAPGSPNPAPRLRLATGVAGPVEQGGGDAALSPDAAAGGAPSYPASSSTPSSTASWMLASPPPYAPSPLSSPPQGRATPGGEPSSAAPPRALPRPARRPGTSNTAASNYASAVAAAIARAGRSPQQ